jgi:hypothetical protein
MVPEIAGAAVRSDVAMPPPPPIYFGKSCLFSYIYRELSIAKYSKQRSYAQNILPKGVRCVIEPKLHKFRGMFSSKYSNVKGYELREAVERLAANCFLR